MIQCGYIFILGVQNFAENMSDIVIPLPDIEIQKKYVDIYNAMLENQKSYEYRLEDLKLACDAYIEDLKHGIHCKAIGPYVERHDVRNRTNEIKNVMGVSTSKEFREPTSKVNRNELSNYKKYLHMLSITPRMILLSHQ